MTADPSLRELADKIAIRELTARYNHLLDDLRLAEFFELWTDDAEFRAEGPDGVVVVAAGREALTEFVESHDFGSVHISADPIIEIDGDAADQQSRLILGLRRRDRATGSSRWVTSATYFDRLVRTDNGWRFASRTFRADALLEEPFPPAGQ